MSHQLRSSFITRWSITFTIQVARYACPTYHPPTSLTTVHYSCPVYYPPISFTTVHYFFTSLLLYTIHLSPFSTVFYTCSIHYPPISFTTVLTTVHQPCPSHHPPISFTAVCSPLHYLPACLTNLIIHHYTFMSVTSHYHIHHCPGTSFTTRSHTCFSPRPS